MKQRTYLHHFYSPSRSARESFFYVESTGHYWCDKSFFEHSYYKQNYYLIYVKAGKGYVYDGDDRILVTPRQLLFLNLSEPYKFHSHKTEPWEFVWVLFGGKDATLFYNSISPRNRQVFDIGQDSILPGLMDEIYALYGQKDPFIELKTHALISRLLVDLSIESMTASSENGSRDYKYPDPVNLVISHIEQNYFRKITLEELAAITFLNPFYLLKLFNKHTGYTPGVYINKFRLDYSKQLLAKPEMTIEQIALYLGFNTHSYFSKLFKRDTGLTPAQFRKIYIR